MTQTKTPPYFGDSIVTFYLLTERSFLRPSFLQPVSHVWTRFSIKFPYLPYLQEIKKTGEFVQILNFPFHPFYMRSNSRPTGRGKDSNAGSITRDEHIAVSIWSIHNFPTEECFRWRGLIWNSLYFNKRYQDGWDLTWLSASLPCVFQYYTFFYSSF